jgi:glutamine synthetase
MQNQIEIASRKIINEFAAVPFIGAELEFYLTGDEAVHNDCLALIFKTMIDNHIQVTKIEKENGHNQYEIALGPISDAYKLATHIEFLRSTIYKSAQLCGVSALLDAKPFEDQPGSALHINISLLNSEGKNLFAKKADEPETEMMVHSIGGLLDTMLVNMVHFAPKDCSYKRFTAKPNPAPVEAPTRTANNAPVNVSWGSNNRTTAIRIPSSTLFAESRHIEHRVSGSDAAPEMVVLKILEGIYHGLKNKCTPPEKIHGNAFDSQYSFLVPLPKTIDEARKIVEEISA